jgi:hypothetical protein
VTERRIEYVSVDSLVPADRNPKRHHLAGIASSMTRFGYTTPIEIDERTGKIVSGHGRVEALVQARQEGSEPPEGVQVDGKGRWLVPVTRGWSSRDDAEAMAYVVAANTLTEVGEWDFAELADVFEELKSLDMTLIDTTGWSLKEANDLVELMALPLTPAELSQEIGPHDPGTFARRVVVLLTRDEHGRFLTACGDAPDDRERFLRMLTVMESTKAEADALPAWDEL